MVASSPSYWVWSRASLASVRRAACWRRYIRYGVIAVANAVTAAGTVQVLLMAAESQALAGQMLRVAA
jgi:hypothetical protein